jgi:hypothetical protein
VDLTVAKLTQQIENFVAKAGFVSLHFFEKVLSVLLEA